MPAGRSCRSPARSTVIRSSSEACTRDGRASGGPEGAVVGVERARRGHELSAPSGRGRQSPDRGRTRGYSRRPWGVSRTKYDRHHRATAGDLRLVLLGVGVAGSVGSRVLGGGGLLRRRLRRRGTGVLGVVLRTATDGGHDGDSGGGGHHGTTDREEPGTSSTHGRHFRSVADLGKCVLRLDVGDGVREQVGQSRVPFVMDVVHDRSSRYSLSRVRNVADPREAWLLTAPRLMPRASAISASERSR